MYLKHCTQTLVAIIILGCGSIQAQDPLPAWNDGPAKQAILKFVARVTDESGPDFVPPEKRIATFDNDGTLWVEKPIYTQIVFLMDRVKQLAPQHPEWNTQQPYAAVLAGDLHKVASYGVKEMLDMGMATHTGMTADEFERIVTDWITTAKHPRFKRLYTECVYQPQLELLAYLRASGFKTFIVSGGGIDFMRPWTARVYGIPPPQVVGSSIVLEYKMHNGKSDLMRMPKINLIDDMAGKPIGIGQHIGQRPILAFGNSIGDREMLEYTTDGSGPRLGLLVFHNDAEREYAYGPADGMPKSEVGTFPQSLMDEANKSGWIVVGMKENWKVILSP